MNGGWRSLAFGGSLMCGVMAWRPNGDDAAVAFVVFRLAVGYLVFSISLFLFSHE